MTAFSDICFINNFSKIVWMLITRHHREASPTNLARRKNAQIRIVLEALMSSEFADRCDLFHKEWTAHY